MGYIDRSILSRVAQTISSLFVKKESGKGLSSTDFTVELNSKLTGIEAGAQVNTLTGVKGDSESSYRTGNVNITKTNIGLGNVENKSSATIRSELTSSNVTSALGYTPPQTAGDVNVIETIKVNGVTQTITNKSVDITIPNYIDGNEVSY